MKGKKAFIILGLVIALALLGTFSVSAVSGAAYTTFNAHVDGDPKDLCKNSDINCNIYYAKEYVWLNGGPTANGLGPDGEYFFAVLVPGGQPNPNDGGFKNLSDDYDAYTNRTFTVSNGEVSAYSGTHWLDSGKNEPGPGDPKPNGLPPYIRLFPYADTWNPGGVYIMAICSLQEGYPVEPRDCKYDAFKVKQVERTASLYLSGMKFEDMDADGVKDVEDLGLAGWEISITGTGFLGEAINATATTDADGFWEFQLDYTYTKFTDLYTAHLTVCETPQTGWTQSYPADPVCYTLDIEPASLAQVLDLDFGNWYPAEKSGVKFEDLDADGLAREAGEPGLEGWTIYVDYDNDGELDLDEPYDVTDATGSYTITGITPGTWTVREDLQSGWTCSYPNPCTYVEEFTSSAELTGNDFGNWYPATKGGYKWYDRNTNGIWDEGEVTISGWKIEVYQGDVLVASQFTDVTGYYEFSLKPGSYTVKEICPSSGSWSQTWPVPTDGCGSGVYLVTLVSSQVETDNDFGNYCACHADFDTKGYWHNQNGLNELYNDPAFATLLAYINSLDPYNDPSGYFDNGEEPFDGYDEFGNPVPPAIGVGDFGLTLNEISQFLVDPNAGGGGGDQEQLAQQLLAFIFNVNYRLGDPGTMIWLDGSWVSAQSVIDAALAAWTSPTTDDDVIWEPILDGFNNNDMLPYISYEPCQFTYP